MENTCERILGHGDKDPQILVDRLKTGGPEPQVAMDAELARQLMAQEATRARGARRSGGAPSGAGAVAPIPVAQKGRGTQTTLPEDFLRVPGYKIPASAGASAAMDDETLARMLQDELFSEELARNPAFAHLARGGSGARGRRSNARIPPGQRRPGGSGAPPNNPFEGVNVMEKLSGT
jgi:hypothetical protein